MFFKFVTPSMHLSDKIPKYLKIDIFADKFKVTGFAFK